MRIVAAFTGVAAQHDAALRPRLRHPDRLVAESRQHSLFDLRRVQEEIERTLEQRATQAGRRILTSIGEGTGVIRVALRAGQENLASELDARYGSAVELRVGGFSSQTPAQPSPAARRAGAGGADLRRVRDEHRGRPHRGASPSTHRPAGCAGTCWLSWPTWPTTPNSLTGSGS
ncbi:MAG TPA: hypothetical protein VHN16_02735 [Streptosporangiaceae bacterium]|nr:hypothetical protein [Streptosporangiaceae bacterium]